tara:strand:+ start:123 stop:410 length:288 start_codon:yes stop_codon:yes gene_type:complete
MTAFKLDVVKTETITATVIIEAASKEEAQVFVKLAHDEGRFCVNKIHTEDTVEYFEVEESIEVMDINAATNFEAVALPLKVASKEIENMAEYYTV